MPRAIPASRTSRILAHATANPGATGADIASDITEVSEATVNRLLRRYGPVANGLRSINRDLFTGAFQYAAIESLDSMYADKAAKKLTAGDRRNYAVSCAVFAEKALLFAGQPTQIVAGMHEVRVQLPDLMAKLAEVGARIRQVGQGSTASTDGAWQAESNDTKGLGA